ncbi:MAG: DUF5674 family protein [Patescibacteria group bacterium]
MDIRIIKTEKPIEISELLRMANEGFGDLVKAAVDIAQEIMAIGGELHADEEAILMEQENSKRENTWGINIYPKKPPALRSLGEGREDERIEFDSMINLKPAFGNRSRNVESDAVKEKIRQVVKKLIKQ